MSAVAFLSLRWRNMTVASRDMLVIVCASLVAWLTIEKLAICDEVFGWIAENPKYEVDSIIIVFVLSSFGTALFAGRRYHEMKVALKAKDEAEAHIRELAYKDMLTGVSNRRALLERLDRLGTIPGQPARFALTILDLDKFKSVNDSHGHPEGDELLLQVTQRLQEQLHGDQELYRLGGDEFAVITFGASDLEQELASSMANVLQALSEPFSCRSFVHHVGSSAGSALYPRHGHSTALLRAADIAMYKAKEDGGGRHQVYTDAMDREIREQAVLEAEMRSALSNGEFVAFYQPIVELKSGKLQELELLARWNRPDGKYVGPDKFIPIAEEFGMINELMLQLLEQYCNDARHWPEHITVAINLSAVQLRDSWLGQKILAVLVKHGISPRRLAVEVTETAIISDESAALRTISSLRNQGVSISLDDFGTGYSSLHYLRTLPFDKLKIDRSFILSLFSSTDSEKIVNSVVALAHSLGLTVVAEGIESQEIADKLRAIGCAEGQGYFFGRPGNAAAVLNLMEQQLLPKQVTPEMASPAAAQYEKRGVA